MLPLLVALAACGDVPTPARDPLSFSGAPTSDIALWNGFSQAWGYNHRLNSLGDWVGPVTCADGACEAPLGHSAASGSGSDLATWESRFTTVSAPGVSFLQGSTDFLLDVGRAEGDDVAEEVEVSIVLPTGAATTVLLGGYDLYALTDADRPAAFEVAIGDARVEPGETPDGSTVTFPVRLSLRMDCDSPECDRFDGGIAYAATVAWVVATGDALSVTDGDFGVDYAWEADGAETTLDDTRRSSLQIVGEPDRPASALGLRRLSFDLDDDHHYSAWASAVRPVTYDLPSGTATFDLDLLFQQWNAETADRLLSYTEGGEADLQATVSLLQFADACVASGAAAGELAWEADGGDANSDAPVVTTVARWEACP